jgi:hypothetical protein
MKRTTAMQALELTKTKLVIRTAFISLLATSVNFGLSFIEKIEKFGYWKVIAVSSFIILVVVGNWFYKVIMQKQESLDQLKEEMYRQAKMKSRVDRLSEQHKKK